METTAQRTFAGTCGTARMGVVAPDGSRVVFAHQGNGVSVFDVDALERRLLLPWYAEALAISGDATTIAVLVPPPDGPRLELVELATGAARATWPRPDFSELPAAWSGSGLVALSADGRRVAVALTREGVWCGEVGGTLARVAATPEPLSRLEVAPDGTWVAGMAADGTLTLWSSSESARGATAKTASPDPFRFDPDGQSIVVFERQGPFRLAVPTLDVVQKTTTYACCEPAMRADGKRWALANAETLKVLDAATGEKLLDLKGPKSPSPANPSLAFRGDGEIVVARGDAAIIRYDLARGAVMGGATPPRAALSPPSVAGIAYSPRGDAIATASLNDEGLALWFPDSGARVVIDDARGWSCVRWTGALELAATDQRGGLSVFSLNDDLSRSKRRKPRAVQLGRHTPLAFVVSDAGLVASLVGHGGQVAFHALDTLAPLGSFVPQAGQERVTMVAGGPHLLAFQPGSQRLALAGAGRDALLVEDAPVASVVRRLSHHAAAVTAVAFDRSGRRLATGDAAGQVAVWDVGSGDILAHFAAKDPRATFGEINALAFAPDDVRLAVAAGSAVTIWRADTGERLDDLGAHDALRVGGVAWHPSADRLAVGSGQGGAGMVTEHDVAPR